MTAAWMLCLLGTAALSLLMAANGQWRKHPALFVYLLILTVQSLALWALFTSRWYSVVYYGLGMAAQITELWVMVELSLQVTAASPAVDRLLRTAIPVFALFTLLWTSYGALNEARVYPSLVGIASRLDSAVSLSWAATLILLVLLISGAGCQFSHGARGIASGFLLEVLSSNVTAYLYIHTPSVSYLSNFKTITYGATILVWTATLARPHGLPNLARLQAIPPHALALTADPLNGPLTKGISGQ